MKPFLCNMLYNCNHTCLSKSVHIQFLFATFKMLLNAFTLRNDSRLFLERGDGLQDGLGPLEG